YRSQGVEAAVSVGGVPSRPVVRPPRRHVQEGPHLFGILGKAGAQHQGDDARDVRRGKRSADLADEAVTGTKDPDPSGARTIHLRSPRSYEVEIGSFSGVGSHLQVAVNGS